MCILSYQHTHIFSQEMYVSVLKRVSFNSGDLQDFSLIVFPLRLVCPESSFIWSWTGYRSKCVSSELLIKWELNFSPPKNQTHQSTAINQRVTEFGFWFPKKRQNWKSEKEKSRQCSLTRHCRQASCFSVNSGALGKYSRSLDHTSGDTSFRSASKMLRPPAGGTGGGFNRMFPLQTQKCLSGGWQQNYRGCRGCPH